jgi:hypothetical protein
MIFSDPSYRLIAASLELDLRKESVFIVLEDEEGDIVKLEKICESK